MQAEIRIVPAEIRVVPIETDYGYHYERNQTKRQIQCISLWTLFFVAGLVLICLSSAYIYICNNVTPNGVNPSNDVKYYKYFDFKYKYDGYYKNYTITNSTSNDVTIYNAKYSFGIITTTDRTIDGNNFVCDSDSTTDAYIAQNVFPAKYRNNEMKKIYFRNDNPTCTIVMPESQFAYLYASIVLDAGLSPILLFGIIACIMIFCYR
jgi:hypothetical protein